MILEGGLKFFFIPILLIMTFLGFPLFLSLGGLALWGYYTQDLDLRLFFGQFLRLTSSPLLSCIPLFTFSGYILAHTNAPNRLLRVARLLMSWIPGGIGIIAVLLLAVFTSFTGASGVTIIALGGLFYPFLTDYGSHITHHIRMIGVEAGGLGIETGKHAARFAGGSLGVFQGCTSYLLQDDDGN
ncbi:MAG: TRAP transporter large permease subunit, partial [bacterium]